MPVKAKASARKTKDPCAELKRKLKALSAELKKRDAELKERDAKLNDRDAELKEAREQQAATAEILKVISSSPTDIQPVFEAILDNARRLCGAHMAGLRLYEGNRLRNVAQRGIRPEHAKWIAEEARKYSPTPEGAVGRMIAEKRPIHVLDQRESVNYRNGNPTTVAAVDLGGIRTMLAVPMLKEGQLVGGIVVSRPEVRAFTQKQIDLISTFASQAVIAIENVRLFKELQARNAEITEALEQQTATAEILKVISSSPTDTQPVFDVILENATRLCDSHLAILGSYDGEKFQVVAAHGINSDTTKFMLDRGPFQPNPGGDVEQMLRDAQPVHTEDMKESAGYKNRRPIQVRMVEQDGVRTRLAVPMIKDGRVVGSITIFRPEVRPFTEKQIELVSTFASQAVIAIENVRLFQELQTRNAEITEALEQQTATAEILKVISSSPTDTQPVFEAILDNAMRLCDAPAGGLRLYDGEHLRRVAGRGASPEFSKWAAENPLTPGPSSGSLARLIAERKPMHILDRRETRAYREGNPTSVAQVELNGVRTSLFVPMLKEGRLVGAIVVNRREVRAFTEKQIALLETFADQAVIAVENVRLFKELQSRNAEITEALEQQTATAEILKVISSSPTDLKPVFDAILESATQLCDAHMANLMLYDGDKNLIVAQRGGSAEYAKWVTNRGPYRPLPSSAPARMIAERQPIQVADLAASSPYRERSNPNTIALVELGGARSYMVVPMLKEGRVVGGITIYRPEVRPFTQKQIDLMSTFASQAVIAIENVRLFKEIQEKNHQLEIASRHKSEFLASMSHELRTPLNAILGFNEMIIYEMYGAVPPDMKVPLEDIQSSGKHLLRLINNVLDLAKIEAGRMELALEDYSIMDTTTSVHSALRPLAAEKGLEFVVTVPEDIPLVYGDSGRIMQCLINLAGNSLKFTKAGKVEISVGHHDGLLTCCVSDTGVGIPPDKIGGLFTEFKQTDASIASEYGGTGLGLSITRKFIEMHGGRIWVESEVGQGSRFIFEIPLRVVAQATEEAHA